MKSTVDVREYAENLTDNEKAAPYPEATKQGMAEMSEKFKQMSNEIYVEADAVKKNNKAF